MIFNSGQILAYAPMLILIAHGLRHAARRDLRARHEARAASRGSASLAASRRWAPSSRSGATPTHPETHFQGMLIVDRMALFLDGAFIVAGLVTLLFSGPYLREQGFEFGEFYAMVLFGVAGMTMVAHATHMVSLLIGIETMSLAAYVLTGSWRRSLRSSEGAMKYFLMGAFATGFLVYGMALVYGTTGGEMSYSGIASKVGDASKAPMFFLGEYFIIIALAFKVAAVPFHMWAPDTYEGAPTPVTGFMAAGVKAAAFGGILRLLGTAFGSPLLVFDFTGWASILSVLAALTMTLGNLAAIRQENIKRLLAYSSIAHAGYCSSASSPLGLGVGGAQARCSSTWSATPSRRWARSASCPGSATARTSACSSTTGPASRRRAPRSRSR